MAATIFSRDGAAWTGRVVTREAMLQLPAIGITLDLAGLYAGVELVDEEPDD